MNEYRVLGKPLPLIDSVEKVRGELQFIGDLPPLRRMLHAKVLRSPYPHARVVKIDTARAEALPGVRAVITHKNTPSKEWREVGFNYKGRVIKEIARFIGDEVAAVAAVDKTTAEKALALIDVEYEELPAVFDMQAAALPDAPRILPGGNVHQPVVTYKWGDMERGFREADFVIELKAKSGNQQHAPLDRAGCIAAWAGGNITIWTTSQKSYALRDIIADLTDIPKNRVRVISQPTGGSFGFWWENNYHFIPVLLSRIARQPVKLELTREEVQTTVKRRETSFSHVKMGFKNNGKIISAYFDHLLDDGAYGDKRDPYQSATDLYLSPNGYAAFTGVVTNTLTSGCMRGVGDLTLNWAVEQAMDMGAEKFGMDPVEFRLANVMKKPVAVNGSKRIGIGVGAACHISGISYLGFSAVVVTVLHDGTVILAMGSGRMGQGAETTQAQIVAEVLGIGLEDIKVLGGDTDACPEVPKTTASITARMVSPATKLAAENARRQILEFAATKFGVRPEALDIRDRRIIVAGEPSRSIALAEFMSTRTYEAQSAPVIVGSASLGFPPEHHGDRMYMVHFAEVEVDTETCQVKILKYVAAHDSGKIMNPTVCENQVCGGYVMGAGYTLSENLIFDEETGMILNPNFIDYKIPSALDLPDPEVIFVEAEDPYGAYGIKGIGEGAPCPVPAAIASAVHNAIGARIEAPITPDKILRALKERGMA
ncbi:MAG: xanthine dehydrogenase family protein molybdopterin-binding subunit [Betaproteobacteria bacterium]|nr:xanthine dehydrogenase family protein molybdopterin-binding subunit [Betaproteobacteria bacterium]